MNRFSHIFDKFIKNTGVNALSISVMVAGVLSCTIVNADVKAENELQVPGVYGETKDNVEEAYADLIGDVEMYLADADGISFAPVRIMDITASLTGTNDMAYLPETVSYVETTEAEEIVEAQVMVAGPDGVLEEADSEDKLAAENESSEADKLAAENESSEVDKLAVENESSEVDVAVPAQEQIYENVVEVTTILESGMSGEEKGRELVEYATGFVGNPYLWGGTSLTSGADCSGFTMTLYAMYGVELPHSSRMQATYGTSVGGIENAQVGDLVVYSGHVAIYMGDGQIVHAANSRLGICVTGIDFMDVVDIRRLL